MIWDRMKNDTTWQVFVKSMWRYQWKGNSVPYTDEMVNLLYDESQGIIDIAVKLYAIVQIEAITGGKESFSAADIHKVAEKKLSLVKPMLDALRSRNRKKILRYEDIIPVSIEDYLSVYQAVKPEISEKSTEKKLTVLEQTVVKLLEVDVEPSVAKRLAGRVLASHKNPVSVGEAFKEAYRLYISEVPDKAKTEASEEDLRKSDGYDDMKKKGFVDETEW